VGVLADLDSDCRIDSCGFYCVVVLVGESGAVTSISCKVLVYICVRTCSVVRKYPARYYPYSGTGCGEGGCMYF
jgi:hypothetical protein